MAYNKTKIFEQAKEAITKNNLFFVEDIVAWLPISKATLYEYFPADSDELNNLKTLLDQNKTRTKSAIRSKLFKSDKASELLALYRLICTPEEHRLLNQQYIESKIDSKQNVNVTQEQLDNIIEIFKPNQNHT